MRRFRKEDVYDCKDYSLMHFLPWNRDKKVRPKLAQKIRDLGFIDSIKVVRTSVFDGEPKLYILDGQNRFYTAKHMKLEYDYTVVAETECEKTIGDLVISYNSMQKPWSHADYARLYSSRGNDNYTRLIAIVNKYQTTYPTTALLLTRRIGRQGIGPTIAKGAFIITDESWALGMLDRIMYLGQGIKISNNFVLGFVPFMLGLSNYDAKKMLKRIKENVEKLLNCKNGAEYQEMFSQIYSKLSNYAYN